MATLTKSQITIVDTTDIKVQSSPPLSPSAGDRWINTGSSPYVLYVNDGAAWQVETDWDILQAFSMHDVVLEDITSDLRVTPFEKSQLLKILTPIFYDADSVSTEAARYNLTASIVSINTQLSAIHGLTDPLYDNPDATSDVSATFDEDLNTAISLLSGLLSSTRISIANSRLVGTDNLVLLGSSIQTTTTSDLLAKFYLSEPLNSNLDKYSIAVKADLTLPRTGIKILYNGSATSFALLTERKDGVYYTSSPVIGTMTPSPEGVGKDYIEIYAEPDSASNSSTFYWVTVTEGTQPMMAFSPSSKDLTDRLGTAEHNISQQATAITSKVSYTEYEALETRIEEVGFYRVEILSTNGSVFKNNQISTTLIARVYKNNEDVTDITDISRFRWSKSNADGTLDIAWGEQYAGGAKQIELDMDDVYRRCTITCGIAE